MTSFGKMGHVHRGKRLYFFGPLWERFIEKGNSREKCRNALGEPFQTAKARAMSENGVLQPGRIRKDGGEVIEGQKRCSPGKKPKTKKGLDTESRLRK